MSKLFICSNTGFCVPRHVFSFSLECIPMSRVAGSYGDVMFNILNGLPNCVPKWMYHFAVPPAIYEDSNFSIFLPTHVIFFFVYMIIAILVGMK